MAAVWSSQYPDAGQSEWLHDGQMPRERLTLAELLSAQGIETAGFIANPSAGPTVGLDRGFGLFERLYREPWHTGGPPDADVFRAAGFEWRKAGCSMCLGMNPDQLVGREMSASSSNRNFIGRQGSPTGRTLLMSPAMVAAAAIAGEVADVREILR